MPIELPASVTPVERIEEIFAGLNPKERVFVKELCLRGSKFSAARVAGYAEGGDYQQAATWASYLIADPRIQLAIKEWQAVQRQEYVFLRDILMQSLIEDAFFDPGDAYDSAGDLKNVPDMPAHVRERVTAYKVQKGGVKTIEFVDRSKAKTQLLQLLGIGQQSQGMTINIHLGDNSQARTPEINVTPAGDQPTGHITLNITPESE